MNPIFSSLRVGLRQLWCIDIYPDKPPQNNAGIRDKFRYELDIRLPALRKTCYNYTYLLGGGSEVGISIHQNPPKI